MQLLIAHQWMICWSLSFPANSLLFLFFSVVHQGILWYGISLCPVWVRWFWLCFLPASWASPASPLIAQYEKLTLSTNQQQLKHDCIINVAPTVNPKYSTLPPIRRKTLSQPKHGQLWIGIFRKHSGYWNFKTCYRVYSNGGILMAVSQMSRMKKLSVCVCVCFYSPSNEHWMWVLSVFL